MFRNVKTNENELNYIRGWLKLISNFVILSIYKIPQEEFQAHVSDYVMCLKYLFVFETNFGKSR